MATVQKSGIVYIPPAEGRFTVSGVRYRGESCTYDLFRELTPPMTQDKLSGLYGKEKPKGNSHPADLPLTIAIPLAGYDLKDENPKAAEELRNFLKTTWRGNWINTLSRAVYNPNEKDKVIHNHNTSDEYTLNGRLIGQHGFIQNLEDRSTLEMLTGTQDVERLNKMFNWINSTNGYIWRVNSTPTKKTERVAWVGAFSVGVLLDAGRGLRDEAPTFQVVRVE